MGNIKETGNLLLKNKEIDPKKLKEFEDEYEKIQASLPEEQKIKRLKCPTATGKAMKRSYHDYHEF